MKSGTQSKIKQLSALSGAFLISHGLHGQVADPTIDYVNLDPDSILNNTETGYAETSGHIYFDVNADGINDLELKFNRIKSWTTYFNYDYVSHLIEFYGLNQAAVLCNDSLGLDFVYALDASEMINAAADSWQTGDFKILSNKFFYYPAGGTTLLSSFGLGYWDGLIGKFAGVRLKIGAEKYYGWVRLSVTGDMKHISVHDYAFRNVPATGIAAGETGLECNAPFQLDPILLSPTQVKLKWQSVADAVNYKIYYRPAWALTWTTKNVSAPNTKKTINSLLCNTSYEWKMRASCDGGTTFSPFSDTKTFTTPACRLDDEQNNPDSFSVFPNPASEYIYINPGKRDEESVIHIFDISGKLVLEQFVVEDEIIRVNISSLNNGLYMLNISGDYYSATQKIVVNK